MVNRENIQWLRLFFSFLNLFTDLVSTDLYQLVDQSHSVAAWMDAGGIYGRNEGKEVKLVALSGCSVPFGADKHPSTAESFDPGSPRTENFPIVHKS